MGTYAETQHDDFDVVPGRGPIDIVHDQQLLISEARLNVGVGITRRFALSLMLPVRVVDTSIRFLDTENTEVMLLRPSTHHRNETVSGLGDPMLLGSTSVKLGSWRITARGGLTIPIGRTEEDPFALGDAGLPHQHIQLGTGTANPVLGVEAARSWGAWRFGGFGLTQQVVYEGAKGYQAGDRYAVGSVIQRKLGPKWSLRGTVDALAETAERWNGTKPTDDGNQGRFDLIFGVGASFAATPALGLDVSLKRPAITHAVGGQLSMPAIFELGASWSFGGAPKPQHHDHDHGDHDHDDHDEHVESTGLDVADLGKPGEAVDLVPVPGKITIFDFWAAWCQPCKVLEPALVELARAHPTRVAIRRIDVVDWDSAVVARYLKGYDLPHVRVVDPAGKLVLEKSSEAGQLGALIDEIRAIVEGKPAATLPAAPAFRITATEKGFEPSDVVVPVGTPVTLVFTRTAVDSCGTEIILTVDGKQIVKDLPLDTPVELTLTFPKAETIAYRCAMNMFHGTVTARDSSTKRQ